MKVFSAGPHVLLDKELTNEALDQIFVLHVDQATVCPSRRSRRGSAESILADWIACY